MSESDEDGPGFDLGEPPPPAQAITASAQPYRVLARKYRPQRFDELIGQEAMVQTLANAIRRGRLAHAFLMTGVRGVGKTSTARLIAKALNCIGPDGSGGPTIDPCGQCEPCVAIAEGRHIDVVEMDAASNTGVDDVREIIEAVRYASVSARYKIYIIDEVHMLTRNAFNALLKTLEEPPAHVKFLFATTEVNKVPVTVLSRCQRFDLRRIPADRLAAHFATVARAEGVDADDEALMLIARAAEGSARDGLSMLDQAIAHADEAGGGRVTGAEVRAMLGLSDRAAIRDLMDALLAGDGRTALTGVAAQTDLGVDPASVFKGLLSLCHAMTLAKLGTPPDPAQSEEERSACDQWAARLGFATLHRLWQLLLKGHDEVARAADPREAADMALLRIAHASQMPDPGELARMIRSGTVSGPAIGGAASPEPPAAPAPPADYATLVDQLEQHGKAILADELRREFGLVRYTPPEIVLRPLRPLADPNYGTKLNMALREAFGPIWRVSFEEGQAAMSLAEQARQEEAEAKAALLAHPTMRAAMEAFPEAELVDSGSAQRGVGQ